MNSRRLLCIQGIATLATYLLIVISPIVIPNSFSLVVTPQNYVLPYLIGATGHIGSKTAVLLTGKGYDVTAKVRK